MKVAESKLYRPERERITRPIRGPGPPGPRQGSGAPGPGAGKRWGRTLARYCTADWKRSLVELSVTAVPFFLLWASMLYCVQHFGYWACLPIAVPAAGFLVRLFIIQHDCGHGSFFPGDRANDRIGRILGVFTWTPYDYWQRTHAIHHATTGNLDRRGIGDVSLLTVAEYRALPRWQRLGYRLSRNPLVLLALGPAFLFVLKYRLPVGLMREGKKIWTSVMLTNLAILGVVLGMSALVGFWGFLFVQVSIVVLAGFFGVWLFYVQHQFEDTYWAKQGAWSAQDAALEGSTHYDLPGVLRWMTGNIGIHHVHHLASRIPSYRLPEVLVDHPELRALGRLSFRESLKCFRLALWHEESRRLVGFRDLNELQAGSLAAH